MGRPSGSAMLPLHGGRVPHWLASRMARLGRVICEAVALEYGRDALLARLAHPFWFQSFGCVMGMDWHSSGITTSVLGALKKGLAPVADELGLYVCGGRGKHSRKTPEELIAAGERLGLDGDHLATTSRLVAKVDSAAVQDGFQLYLHGFILAADGKWVVVQQGMSDQHGQARRYHWLSAGLRTFVEEPHEGIDGESRGRILNLTDRRARDSRAAQVELAQGTPERVVDLLRKLRDNADAARGTTPHCQMPEHHDVRASDVFLRRLHGTLAAAADKGTQDFEQLLLTPGVGPRTVESLALVSEVIYGAPARFDDPARFSMAHGGKDGHPFPVPLDVFDRTISQLKSAVAQAKLGQREELEALRRLDDQARLAERWADGPDLESFIAQERRDSHRYRGMTVMGPAKPPGALREQPRRRKTKSAPAQLKLPGL